MQSTSSERPRHQADKPGSDVDVRERLQQRIYFAENAAWVKETPLARAFTDVLCDMLLQEDVDLIRVRCGVTRDDESDGLRFMCKVEYAGDGGAAYPWSWWSPLMERPEELAGELRRALKTRRERTVVRAREHVAADKARGPAHDTWSTSPWDLGQGVRPDSFCRNRRGRWTGPASGPKPFRPRSPR